LASRAITTLGKEQKRGESDPLRSDASRLDEEEKRKEKRDKLCRESSTYLLSRKKEKSSRERCRSGHEVLSISEVRGSKGKRRGRPRIREQGRERIRGSMFSNHISSEEGGEIEEKRKKRGTAPISRSFKKQSRTYGGVDPRERNGKGARESSSLCCNPLRREGGKADACADFSVAGGGGKKRGAGIPVEYADLRKGRGEKSMF